MGDVKRYAPCKYRMAEDDRGGYVDYEDHAAEIARLRGELEKTQQQYENVKYDLAQVLVSIDRAYTALGAPTKEDDPDARDSFYIGDAVEKMVARVGELEKLLAELN